MNKRTIGLLTALVISILATGLSVMPASAQSSYSEIVMEANSERVLYENRSDEIMPMASTTKILTALVVIEDCSLDEIYQIPAEACGIEGSSVYLAEGEKLKVSDLLYGLMLRSGNDCAVALALFHSGSIEAFAQAMNERAQQLGAAHSHFVNPHGLPDPKHYTTARDLCKIACAAMRNPVFKQIVSSKKFGLPDSGCGYNRVWVNKNKMLYEFDGANGVKTGYTKAAGRCLVSGAERDGMQLVSVVLNCPPMYERSAEILQQCFTEYSYRTIYLPKEHCVSTEVKGKTCRVFAREPFAYPLKESELSDIEVKLNLPDTLSLPVQKGETVGEMQILFQNQLLFSQKIVSIEDVEKSFIDILRDIAKH